MHKRCTRGAREGHERCTRGAREGHERGTRGAREGHERCTRGASLNFPTTYISLFPKYPEVFNFWSYISLFPRYLNPGGIVTINYANNNNSGSENNTGILCLPDFHFTEADPKDDLTVALTELYDAICQEKNKNSTFSFHDDAKYFFER